MADSMKDPESTPPDPDSAEAEYVPKHSAETRAVLNPTPPNRFGLGPEDLLPLPPPVPGSFQDPVFWTTTIVPIILAVAAFIFHKDLSSLAPTIAATGAGIATIAYAIYSGLRHQAHARTVAAYYAMHTALLAG